MSQAFSRLLCQAFVIFTGTPAGVEALLPGDVVRIEVASLPVLEHAVA
jgi:2-keto-4-pentenoate hydratase/2-oxohepta-3-ene-1,7-dioic acid hydratase in catechol pathway